MVERDMQCMIADNVPNSSIFFQLQPSILSITHFLYVLDACMAGSPKGPKHLAGMIVVEFMGFVPLRRPRRSRAFVAMFTRDHCRCR